LRVSSEVKFRKKLGQVFYDFGSKNLSGFGGLKAFSVFMERLELEEAFSNLCLGYQPTVYSVPRIFCCFVLGMVAGFERVRETARLGRDRSLLAILGWSRFPVQSTLSRVLTRFTRESVGSLVNISAGLLGKFRKDWREFDVLHLDLDSHVRTVYGTEIEEANRGYNPKKKGRRSFHPLLAFIGETRDFLRGKLRAGNTSASTGAVDFLNDCLQQIGLESLYKLVVRADSGFCNTDFLHALEAHPDKVIYALAMRLNAVHQRRFASLTYSCVEDSEPEEGLEIASYISCDWPDKKPRRVVVIRQAIPEDGHQDVCGKQLKLFELQGYAWRGIVTNSLAPPEAVWRDYNHRATCENHIKEAMEFGLDWTASKSFWANAAHLQLVMLTYNLFNWYKEVALNQGDKRNSVRFLRDCIIKVPVILKRSARQIRLSFPGDWHWREELEASFARIEAWKLHPT
jgi:hypothetical protein